MKKRKKMSIFIGTIIVFIICFLCGLYYFNIIPHKMYENADFGIETFISSVDQDEDSIDDQTDILNAAKAYIARKPKYKSKYYAETGYPTDGYGVCTDLVAFAMREAGYDLRELVNQDIEENGDDYKVESADKNIDFRRVRNLSVYFQHHAIALTTDLAQIDEWQGGDIVIMKGHIGIVSDKRNKKGIPFLIHHANPLQVRYEEDVLGTLYQVIGHYRISDGLKEEQEYYKGYEMLKDGVECFAKEVKQQILDYDWKGLSEKLLYPIQIGEMIYKTKEEFAAESFTYDDEFRKVLEKETCEKMFVNSQGIRMGTGESASVWITDSIDSDSFVSKLKVYAINGLLTQEATERRTKSLLMEEVIEIADLPKDFLVLNDKLRMYWIHDKRKELEEKTLAYTTTYSIWYQEEEYLFSITYMKKRAELDEVKLQRVTDGEWIILYHSEASYRKIHQANGKEVKAYLKEHKQMSDYFTIELPSNLIVGSYHVFGMESGLYLISSKEEDKIYWEELMAYNKNDMSPFSMEQYSVGGMYRFYDYAFWEEGKINLPIERYICHANKYVFVEKENGENLTRCAAPAYLEMVEYNLYNDIFLQKTKQKYGEISKERCQIHEWWVYFAKPESLDVYAIWLNADLYSKEEMIAFAESVQFTEKAFQSN